MSKNMSRSQGYNSVLTRPLPVARVGAVWVAGLGFVCRFAVEQPGVFCFQHRTVMGLTPLAYGTSVWRLFKPGSLLVAAASQFPLLICYATAHACALQTQVKALSFPVGWDLEHSAISRHRAARNGGTQSLSWGLWMSHYALPLLHDYCRDRAHWWLFLRQVHVFFNYLM